MKIPNSLWLYFVTFCLLVSEVNAQEGKFSFKGNAGVFGDFYSISNNANGNTLARRPPISGRFALNATLSFHKFSLPISILIFNKQFSTIYPTIPNENIFEFISNPGNRVGIAPKYKWIEFQLGTHVPRFSELSIGDLPQFGIGLNLSPGKFRLSVFSGLSAQAIKPDSARNVIGQYKQRMKAAKIGFGSEDATHIYFIGATITDDTSSILNTKRILIPKKGIVSAIDYRLNLGKKLWLKGEIAGSAFTRDLLSNKIDSNLIPFDIPFEIFVLQESSRLDYASVITLGKEGKTVGFQINAKYIGDGFYAVGYPFMQTDRMDITIDPRLTLLNGKFNLQGSIGKRVNNLSGNRSAESTQILGLANLQINFTEKLSLSANYSNFGFTNTINNDTLKINMVTNAIGFSPVYMSNGKNNSHFFSFTINKDEFRDYNIVSGAINNNDVFSWMINYGLSGLKKPYKFNILYNQLNNKMYAGELRMQSINTSISYSFVKKKFNTLLGFTYSETSLSGNSPSVQLLTSLGLKLAINKKTSFSLSGNINNFSYGDTKPGASFVENFLKTSLNYQF
jgi:hypothetical protein